MDWNQKQEQFSFDTNDFQKYFRVALYVPELFPPLCVCWSECLGPHSDLLLFLLFLQVFSKLFEVARSRVPLASLIPAPRPRLASNNNVKKKN